MKAIELYNWAIFYFDNNYILKGDISSNNKFGGTTQIRPSLIKEIASKDDSKIEIRTVDTSYVCYWKYVNLRDSTFEIDYNFRSRGEIEEVYEEYMRLKLYNNSGLLPNGKDNECKYNNMMELLALGEKEIQDRLILHENKLLSEASKYTKSIVLDIDSISSGCSGAFNLNGESNLLISKAVTRGYKVDVDYLKQDEKLGKSEQDSLDEHNVLLSYTCDYKDIHINYIDNEIQRVLINNSRTSEIKLNNKYILYSNELDIYTREDLLDICK